MPTPRLAPSTFHFGGRDFSPDEVVERLAPFVAEDRQARIEAVIAGRTVSVVPVLERVHDLGNVNAVLRSAEGLGIGAAHLVDLQGEAADWLTDQNLETGDRVEMGRARRQSQGAHKWLDLHVHATPEVACDALRAAGYRIAATHLGANAVPIDGVDFTTPTALVFGNERDGISPEFLARADLNVVLPIDGFIQSYNISVAAALALYHARADRLRRQGVHGDLDVADRAALRAHYYLRSVKAAAPILARFA